MELPNEPLHNSNSANTADSQRSNDSSQNSVREEWLVSCRCESAKSISTLLSCLLNNENSSIGSLRSSGPTDHGRRTANATTIAPSQVSNRRPRSQVTGHSVPGGSLGRTTLVTVFCNPSSLNFHVQGQSKQLQASVDINAGLFSDYRVVDPLTQEDDESQLTPAGVEFFSVNLYTLLECLHVLGTQNLDRTRLCFSYNATKDYLKLELLEEDSEILCSATVPGMTTPDEQDGNGDTHRSLHRAFRSSPIVARFLVKSEILREVIPELEQVAGASVATVELSKHDGLGMVAVGHWGECLVSVPGQGSHVILLDVTSKRRRSVVHSFPMHAVLGSMRGLEIAEESCISMNSKGMMAIQHQVIDQRVGDGRPNFVHFILCPLEEDSDDAESDSSDDEASFSQEPSSYPLVSEQTSSPRRRRRKNRHRHESQDDGTADVGSSVVSSVQSRPTNPPEDSLNSDPGPGPERRRDGQQEISSRGGRVSSQNDAEALKDTEKDSTEDDEEDSYLVPPSQKQPSLFAAMLHQPAKANKRGGSISPDSDLRAARRRRLQVSTSKGDDESASEMDQSSRNLLESSDDEEEFTQPLDAAAPVSPRVSRTEHEICSSPELVYG